MGENNSEIGTQIIRPSEKSVFLHFCSVFSIKYRNSTLFVEYILNILKEFYKLPDNPNFEYKYILFDLKKGMSKTPTKTRKIKPETLTDSDDGTKIAVYRIHHLHSFLNIRHLQL